MTTILYREIVKRLKKEFGLKVYSVNTEEGFETECFYVEMASSHVSDLTSGQELEDSTFRITFFPKKKGFARALEVKEKLQEIFKTEFDAGEGCMVPITERTFSITTNDYLELLIGLQTVTEKEQPDNDKPKMEILHFSEIIK